MIPTTDHDIKRVYDPDTLMIMTLAFERACAFLPREFKDNARARRRVALHIINRVDIGERDPMRLADSALLSIQR